MRLLPFLAAVALTGCNPFSLSPPTRSLPLESSATLRPGVVAVQGSAGGHSPDDHRVISAAGRARLGIAEGVELQGEGNYYDVAYGDVRRPSVGTGRIGVKYAPIEHFALVAGFGAGAHTHGAFLGPDMGIVAAYENPYFVPWGAFRSSFSLPVSPNTQYVWRETETGVEAIALYPTNTWSWQLTTGFRVPWQIDRDVGLNFLFGGGILGLRSLEVEGNNAGGWQFEGGIEIVIGSGPPPEPEPERAIDESAYVLPADEDAASLSSPQRAPSPR